MKILVTGSRGFIGKNLCEAIKCIRDGKDRRARYSAMLPITLFECDRNTTDDELEGYCAEANFVFNLAGVNRPQNEQEFKEGNTLFPEKLVKMLERSGNTCPVLSTSSIQASLEGRYADSPYGESKLLGEKVLREHCQRTGAPVLIYRLPNVYGKWCRPNYNSVVATFCFNIAHDLPIRVDDPTARLNLLYIDDLIGMMLEAPLEQYPREMTITVDSFPCDDASLEEIVQLLREYREARSNLSIPTLVDGGFSKKLYSTYESYLDPLDLSYQLTQNVDARGSFAELFRTPDRGQVSINVVKPLQVKGNHWHNTKWEKFVVVSGAVCIQLRKVGCDDNGELYPAIEYMVDGSEMRVIETPPGYTHNIINVSETDDAILLIWSNETFDPENPDTFYEEV